MCGKPEPVVEWKVGSKELNGSIDKTLAAQHQYTYTITTKLTSDMCGKQLTYAAQGFKTATGSSLILMKGCKFQFVLLLFSKFKQEVPRNVSALNVFVSEKEV